MIDRHHGWNKSFMPLFIGLTLSFLLVVAAYRLDTRYHLPPGLLEYTLFGLALAQAAIQFVFYFHIGLEDKPAWNMISLLFVVLIIFIVIGGSFWIMTNLDYNVMPMPM